MSTGAAIHTAGAALLSALILLIPSQVHGQDDFLFGRPAITLSLYGGWAMPAEASDVFAETRRELTVREGDFDAPMGMAELAYRRSERVDLALGILHSSRTVDSQMAEWEWADDSAIRQATHFTRTGAMASAKLYLLPRGREISRFAWVPYRWSPYVGGGAGIFAYTFSQAGDFAVQLYPTRVDCIWPTQQSPEGCRNKQSLRDILELDLRSQDSGFTAHGLAGVQMSVTPRVLVRGEYRYIWGSAELDPAVFEGFEDIDLSGSNIMLGLSIRI